mgnify:CR=1 FL=1
MTVVDLVPQLEELLARLTAILARLDRLIEINEGMAV